MKINQNIGSIRDKMDKILKVLLDYLDSYDWQSFIFRINLRVAEDLNKKELQKV